MALAKDPRQRYRSPRELADDLVRAAAGDPLDDRVGRAGGVAGVAGAAPTLTDGVADAPPAAAPR